MCPYWPVTIVELKTFYIVRLRHQSIVYKLYTHLQIIFYQYVLLLIDG